MSGFLLTGYYGEWNAGDDAFVVTLCRTLQAGGITEIGVLAAELPRVPALAACPLYLRRRWRGLADHLEAHRIATWGRRGAGLIVGGGSLLRDRAGLAALDALITATPRGPHYALGVSIGPFRDADAPAHAARLLERFTFVGVRDTASLDRARALAPTARVELTFDLAPLLPHVEPALSPPPMSARRGIGIALCAGQVSPAESRSLAAALADLLDHDPGTEVVLLAFNSHPRKGDVALHDDLATMVGRPARVTVVRYDGNPLAMWRRIAGLRGLIAMRLHAAVFAHSAGTPTFLVPYEEKGVAWGAMVGHPPHLVGPLSAAATPPTLAALASGLEALPRLSAADAAHAARANFGWLGS